MKDKLGFIFVSLCWGLLSCCFFYYAAPHVPRGIVDHSRADPFNDVRIFYPACGTFLWRVGSAFGVIAICLIALPENSLPDPAALP